MNHSKIAVRYAKALLEFASEQKQVESVARDVHFLQSFLIESPELQWIINSPIVRPSEKASIFTKLFQTSVQAETLTFLLLVVKNGRETSIPDILRDFLSIMRNRAGIQFAHFSSPVAISAKTLEEVKAFTESYFKTKVELSASVKTELLGGFTLQVEDQLLDASIRTKLKTIKQSLLKA